MPSGLYLHQFLAGGIAGCVLLAFGPVKAQIPNFPSYPRNTDADPSVRHQVVVSMPTRLSVERTADHLAIGFDPASLRKVRITVGSKMTIGVKYEMRVFAKGDPRPTEANVFGDGEIREPVDPSHSGFLSGRDFLNIAQGGIPAKGKLYIIEEAVSLFETDVPAQHMWSPTGGSYRVLWTETLKTTR